MNTVHDVVIENGRVVDGTGAAWFYTNPAARFYPATADSSAS